jgi:hypothetical protein
MAKKNEAERKVQVTTRALILRINRKLADKEERLKAARGRRAREYTTGRYYIIDTYNKQLCYADVDLVKLGRKVGALQPWEELADE